MILYIIIHIIISYNKQSVNGDIQYSIHPSKKSIRYRYNDTFSKPILYCFYKCFLIYFSEWLTE